jgi:hypothetical protein
LASLPSQRLLALAVSATKSCAMSMLSGQVEGPTCITCQTYGGLKQGKLVVEPRNGMQSMDKNGMYQIKR